MWLSGQLKTDLMPLQEPSSEFFYFGRRKPCTDISIAGHSGDGGVRPDSNERAKK